ncbi:hypothetical protein AAVH_01102 [Aphelenchoides avenae]|nr:hypothetical protein AAVH_39353 [Aphelenchus avenae]KAH7732204.1 hypothetical protein AAVH_01102 [Aphelenchus avenae]
MLPPASPANPRCVSNVLGFPNPWSLHSLYINGQHASQERSVLSPTLLDNLLHTLPSTCNQQLPTQQEIYKEIVCECAQLERDRCQFHELLPIRSTNENAKQASGLNLLAEAAVDDRTAKRKAIPERAVCLNCHHLIIHESQLRPILESVASGCDVDVGKTSHILITVARDDQRRCSTATSTTSSDDDPYKRKREKNNEAARRYRMRRKETRAMTCKDLDDAVKRNAELKQELAKLQSDIDTIKRVFRLE